MIVMIFYYYFLKRQYFVIRLTEKYIVTTNGIK